MKSEPAVAAATVAAAATIAQQVIGKATRDAMFLSFYTPGQLPLVMIASAIVSIGVIAAMTAAMRKHGPLTVVPAAFALHAIIAGAEWGIASYSERAVAVIVYIHTASVGATIVSGFWSVVSEAFDPHTAKQVVGRIGAGAALGGVIGGGIAWGASHATSVSTMLLVIAALSMLCAWSIRNVAASAPEQPIEQIDEAPKGLGALRDTPYLRLLALIVFASAITQSLIEYALGTEATKAYGPGANLLSFFALFQTVVGVLSFILQLSINRLSLERLGVGPTLALLPAGVVGLGLVALGWPVLLVFALQRGAEGVLRASLFRSAYEVLFAPVPQASKRAAKTTIDVGFDRIGMVLGSSLTLALIAWAPHAVQAVTIGSIAAGGLQLVIAYQLQRGYVATLADRLRSGKLVFAEADVVDATTRHTLSQTTEGLDRSLVLAQIEALRLSKGIVAGSRPPRFPLPENPEIEATAGDDRVQLMADLRSPDERAVERALQQDPERLAPLAFELLELLGRDRVAQRARRVLRPLIPRMTGTTVDFILDDRRDPAARRRAARLLGSTPSQRVVDALTVALDINDLGIRYACGHALVRMRERAPTLKFDYYATRARARHELDLRDSGASDARHLEHAFNLFSLVFPQEPMQLAYGALSGTDPQLRGIALEYLEVTLPPQERAALQRTLETIQAERPSLVPGGQALAQLVEKRDAIKLSLDAVRRERDDDPPAPAANYDDEASPRARARA